MYEIFFTVIFWTESILTNVLHSSYCSELVTINWITQCSAFLPEVQLWTADGSFWFFQLVRRWHLKSFTTFTIKRLQPSQSKVCLCLSAPPPFFFFLFFF